MAEEQNGRECVYVIGAGFSAGLGYPLTNDLLMRLWNRIDDPFKKRLERVVKFHHPGFNAERFGSFPNIEQLLSEMLVNVELFDASRRYEGKFKKIELQTLQRDLLLKIADWFHELSRYVRPGNPRVPWLRAFRDRVRRENAAIISFNWDLILDELLFGKEIDGSSYSFTESAALPILLKPHGSLNWFEEDQGLFFTENKRRLVFEGNNDANRGSIYAFQKFRAPISKHDRIYTPLIIPPVYSKDFRKPVFIELWNNCTATLSTARKVVFLGYSMPTADLHAQFIMRCGFHNQIEGQLVKGRRRTKPTGASEVIIVNPDRGAAQRIEAVAGPNHQCRWFSTPIADWIRSD